MSTQLPDDIASGPDLPEAMLGVDSENPPGALELGG